EQKMKWIDFLAEHALALAAKNEINAPREERRNAALEQFPPDAALLGHFMPDDAHRVGTRSDIVDGVDNRGAATLLVSVPARQHLLGRLLHPLENATQHCEVQLFLGGKMM